MKTQSISIGTTVRVPEHHKIAERRHMVGTIVNHYGQDGYMVVDVCFSDRLRWLFWPEDLEVISSPPAVVAFANRRWIIGDEPVQEVDGRSGGHHTRDLYLSAGKQLRPTPTFPRTQSCRQPGNSERLLLDILRSSS